MFNRHTGVKQASLLNAFTCHFTVTTKPIHRVHSQCMCLRPPSKWGEIVLVERVRFYGPVSCLKNRMFIGFGLWKLELSALRDPPKPSKLSAESVIKMASCFALTCNACANILHSVMNKTWGHVEVLNKRSTQELIVTSQGEKGTQDKHRATSTLCCPLWNVFVWRSHAPLWLTLGRPFSKLRKWQGRHVMLFIPRYSVNLNKLLIR